MASGEGDERRVQLSQPPGFLYLPIKIGNVAQEKLCQPFILGQSPRRVGDEDQLFHAKGDGWEKGAGRSQNHGIVWAGKDPWRSPSLERVTQERPGCSCRPFPAVLDGKVLLSRSFLPHPHGEGKQRLQHHKWSFCLAGTAQGCASNPSRLVRDVFDALMIKLDFRPCR